MKQEIISHRQFPSRNFGVFLGGMRAAHDATHSPPQAAAEEAVGFTSALAPGAPEIIRPTVKKLLWCANICGQKE
ncbi:hypothetical protein EYF80_061235 [Liparis tanakae]|uniref:Uncharacterized protein n=1 Tax=Liparis tanakae TaxID=230148 RepID=A0A4Z2EI38_9TELE|nr:hypothetical protein EYF80_061235 [Liparis tanakae]